MNGIRARGFATPLGARVDARSSSARGGPGHNLVYRGGRTIASLWYKNVYVGASTWNREEARTIDAALEAAMADPGLNDVLQQYFDTPISAVFLGSELSPDPAPRVVSRASLERSILRRFKSGDFAGADFENTVFNFLLPSGTILTDGDEALDASLSEGQPIPFESYGTSLHGLGGYHGSIHATARGQRRIIQYVVLVYSESRAGTNNGVVVFDSPWKNVVAAAYHQLCEVRTDPDVGDVVRGVLPESGLGWVSDFGEECGDYLASGADVDLNDVFVELLLGSGKIVPLQLQYSNRDRGAGMPRDARVVGTRMPRS